MEKKGEREKEDGPFSCLPSPLPPPLFLFLSLATLSASEGLVDVLIIQVSLDASCIHHPVSRENIQFMEVLWGIFFSLRMD